MVDQSNKTYTVGPYTLNFQNQNIRAISGNENMGELVYKEITGQNIGQTSGNTFCKGQMIAKIIYGNGTSTNIDNSQFSLIDANGRDIQNKFPRFGQTFYIRYYAGDADIKEIKPIVQVNYLKKITNGGSVYRAYTYRSQKIKFKMMQDNANVMYDALRDSRLSLGLSKSGSDWIIKQLSYEYNVFHDMWINGGGSIADKSREIAENVKAGLENEIASEISGWGISGVNVDISVTDGLALGSQFYPGGSIGHTEDITSYNLFDITIVVNNHNRHKDYMDMQEL